MPSSLDDVIIVLQDIDQSLKTMSSRDTQARRSAMSSLSPGRVLGGLSVAGIAAFIAKTIEMEAAIGKLSRQLGMSSATMLTMERASSRFNTSMGKTLLNLQGMFAGIGMEDIGGLVEPLARYGLNIRPLMDIAQSDDADPLGLLKEIQKQWGGLNMRERVKVGQTLGFDQGMMNIMNNPRQFAEYVAQQSVSPEQAERQIKEAEAAKEALDKAGITLQDIATDLANKAIPAIESLVKLGLLAARWLFDVANSVGTLSKKLAPPDPVTSDKATLYRLLIPFRIAVEKDLKDAKEMQDATLISENQLRLSVLKEKMEKLGRDLTVPEVERLRKERLTDSLPKDPDYRLDPYSEDIPTMMQSVSELYPKEERDSGTGTRTAAVNNTNHMTFNIESNDPKAVADEVDRLFKSYSESMTGGQ